TSVFSRTPARNPMAFAARRSNGPCRTRLIVSSSSSPTSPMLFNGRCEKSVGSSVDGCLLCLCLDPIFAANAGSKCRAHLFFPVTAQAPHRLPLLFFTEHRLD